MAKRISMRLSESEIDKAIKSIHTHEQEIIRKVKLLVTAISDKGAEIAKVQVRSLGAVDTGKLEASIDGYFDVERGIGIVKADTPYAVYVEFGTGIVGAESPHPDKGSYVYDVNKHGEKGWVYHKNGRFYRTKGQPSRPFMYFTARELEQIIPEIARKVFGK